MELIIKIKGKDIKDIKMTQNGKGEYIYSKILGYANIAMKDFEEVLLNVPKGYKKYSNGSHKDYLSQKAIDLSTLGIAIANKDFKVTKKAGSGIQRYIQGKFRIGTTNKWGNEMLFVHAANDYVQVGDIIKAGKAIAECVHNHFHLFMVGKDFYQFYLNQSPQYVKGQKLIFTGEMNYRSQKGQDIGDIKKNAVCELKSNAVWGTVAGWTGWWYDADFLDKTGGQIADTKLNTTTDKPVSNIDSTVPKPPTPCEEYKKEIERLEQELRASEEALDDTLKELEEVKAENVLLLEDKDFLVRLSTDLKDSQRYAVE